MEYIRALANDDFSAHQHLVEIVLPLLARHGPFVVGPPYWEGLRGGLYEVRSEKVRVYCSAEPERRVVMYIAVTKRWRRFRESDRRLCNTAMADFRSPDYDQQHREQLHIDFCKRRGGT